ncbi:MAG: D-tyrosyl-tRNA(Tyr) deacylase [Elusimicrobia bacterium]|nr:D-tyrosyl-tRNA(Tyr) deacylase [Elusimicrobiota bacterium]
MKAFIQRAKSGKVRINGQVFGEIQSGYVILLGVGHDDNEKDAELLAEKTANLRIFSNQEGKFDYSLLEVKGQALVVSQFTLMADLKKGRRPDFTKAAQPSLAEKLYLYFVQCLKNKGIEVKTGKFGSEMEVEIINHGPVTIMLDTENSE